MPAKPSNRQSVTVRLSSVGVERIDVLAAERGVDRSEMVRRLLAYAVTQAARGVAV